MKKRILNLMLLVQFFAYAADGLDDGHPRFRGGARENANVALFIAPAFALLTLFNAGSNLAPQSINGKDTSLFDIKDISNGPKREYGVFDFHDKSWIDGNEFEGHCYDGFKPFGNATLCEKPGSKSGKRLNREPISHFSKKGAKQPRANIGRKGKKPSR